MSFDFKKEYKEFYLPKKKPTIVKVPKMNYLAVRGQGDPNDPEGEYIKSIQLLYGIAYTLKMSYRSDYKIEGFFEYVVPPLEGFWWQEGIKGMDYSRKDLLKFISLIRLPDFVTKKILNGQLKQRQKRKNLIFQVLNFLVMMKDYVFNVCILGRMITSQKR